MKDKKLNVLIFPAGSEIGLEIHNSLKYNLHVELFGASGKPDHAKYIYDVDHYYESDLYISSPDFIENFNSVLTKFEIDFVFPTHDSIVLFLSQHREKLKACLLTSPYETTLVAREKRLTYNCFKNFDFCTKIFHSPYSDLEYPLFLKPNKGQGAKGTYIVTNEDDLQSKLSNDQDDLLVCEYLPGRELSVDCFTNKDGELLFVGPRVRARIEIGVSFNTFSIPLSDEVNLIAHQLNEKLIIRGGWFFQVKEDKNGKFKLMEFATRQSSTMALYRQVGVNFALLSIFDALGENVKILKNNFSVKLDRCLQSTYQIDIDYDCIYIDFDDTIIINEKVNYLAIRFLYQCRNENKKICLLTKHKYDLTESLKKYCLATNLFDEIILIDQEDEKAKYIVNEKSIFIDNYFFDREIVLDKKKIPVFDVDAIECLLKQ